MCRLHDARCWWFCTLLAVELIASPACFVRLLQDFLPSKCGIHTTFVPISDLSAVASAVTDRWAVSFTERK